MTLTNTFENFPLTELFHGIDQERESSRLSLFIPISEPYSESETCEHIWFWDEQVVAADRLDGQDLTSNSLAAVEQRVEDAVAQEVESTRGSGNPDRSRVRNSLYSWCFLEHFT